MSPPRSFMLLALLVALFLSPGRVTAQCCGDCNGDGTVAINELITAVNNALGQCGAATPTPTALPTDRCPIDFRDDNSGEGTPDCYYVGRWSQSCGAADLESLWRSDGVVVIVNLLGFDPGLFIGANVTGPTSATIVGWFTQPDASDVMDLGGSITLGADGTTLAVDPNPSPFDVDRCPFTRYRGQLEDVLVPGPAGAARARVAVDPAALARLRAAAGRPPRANFQRRPKARRRRSSACARAVDLPRRLKTGAYGPSAWAHWVKKAPRRMNISSSVVVPKATGQASQSPSPTPAPLSQEASRSAGVAPLQVAPTRPAVHPCGVAHGPPGKPLVGCGEVDWRFTSAGLVAPLS
ncbi:MAG: hypothetical protein U0802_07905 [Candidatus Binatia bacterium]